VFQEKNAQTLLTDSEHTLNKAKQQYQQASTSIDKKAAIVSWHSALDNLEQIPGETLAGKTAQKKLESYQQEFKDVVGLAAGNERISTLIAAAQQFSAQAAKAGQNPPHTVIQWQQVENLWQEAINRLEQVPTQDLEGYAQTQRLLATYQANLAQIRIRCQAEQNSESALEHAQRQIQSLMLPLLQIPNCWTKTAPSASYRELLTNLKKCNQARQLIFRLNSYCYQQTTNLASFRQNKYKTHRSQATSVT
jgi:hypothetical protein